MTEKTVLIVDDNSLLYWVLCRRFSLMGITAVSASTGEEALKKINRKTFNIIFIEINLPDINGLDLLDRIKALSPVSKFILFTSETNEEYRRDAIDKGVIDFIEKPFGFFEIKKLINSIYHDGIERREFLRYTCNIPCNISILNKADAGEEVRNHNYLYGAAVDISQKGIGLRLNMDIMDLAGGRLVRLATIVNDHSFVNYLPSNVTAEVVWVKEQGSEIFTGLKYLNKLTLDKF